MPTPTFAQAPVQDRPGPYVIDARGVVASLPQDGSFFPPIPSATGVPRSGLGIDVGGHVYFLSLGPARLGIGASLLRASGDASPATPASASGAPRPPQTVPDVETRVRMFTPQLSFNFGSSSGWSYVSAGVGQISVRTTTSEFASGTSSTAPVMPARTRQSAALQTINVGGGARWFNTTHIAFTFDVRFHKATGRSREGISTAPVTLLTVSAGISLK